MEVQSKFAVLKDATARMMKGQITRAQFDEEIRNAGYNPDYAPSHPVNEVLDAFPGSRVVYDRDHPPPLGLNPIPEAEPQEKLTEVPPDEAERCPTCSHTIADYIIKLDKSHLSALFKAFLWANEHGKSQFELADIKAQLTQSEYTKFAALPLFGLLGRPFQGKPGFYTIDIKHVRLFWLGDVIITESVRRNPATGVVTPHGQLIAFEDVPSVIEVKAEFGPKMSKYITRIF